MYNMLFLQQWNETYLHYHKANPKQTYYLSMEYLQGRALSNAVGNLDIQNAYANALKQLGHEIENIVEQVVLYNNPFINDVCHLAFCLYFHILSRKKIIKIVP